MKKTALLLLLCALLFLLCGCGRDTYKLTFTIPAGDGSDYVFSDPQLSPEGLRTTISAGAGVIQAKLLLIDETGLEYGPFPLTHEEPVRPPLEKGVWYRVGIAMPHDSPGPLAAELVVENAQLRIE